MSITSARRTLATVAVGVAATAAVGVLATSAAAAPTAPAAPTTAQDVAFVTSNAQSNLAEITLGQLGLSRAQDQKTKALAQVTLTDHEKLQSELSSAAKTYGITLPTAPNAMQKATAATLTATSASAFDLAYAKAEQQGHQLAIATAKTETSSGTDKNVVSYAVGYVPVATMHLDMADAEIAALTSTTPTAVSAGTGGQATTDTGTPLGLEVGAAVGVAVAAGSGVALVRRRRASAIV